MHPRSAPGGRWLPRLCAWPALPLAPLVRLRFTGQQLANVTHYELEQLRCGACGAVFVAHMPPEAGQETYDLSLKVNLAVTHHHLGLPFKRVESFQHMVGMPLPDTTQWELVEELANALLGEGWQQRFIETVKQGEIEWVLL